LRLLAAIDPSPKSEYVMVKKVVVADFDVVPGQYAAFKAIMQDHARVTRETEPGCVSFDVVAVLGPEGQLDTARLALIEVYADDTAYVAHTKQPRMAQLRQSYEGMLSGRRVVRGVIE
jgi:quinol monooxygenase YgiN